MYARNDLYNEQLDDLIENYEPKGKVLIVAPSDTCGMDTLTKDKEKMKKLFITKVMKMAKQSKNT